MKKRSCTILLEGVNDAPPWAKRICADFKFVLISANEVTQAIKRELTPIVDPQLTLAEQIRWIGEHAPEVEAKYLRQRGIGRERVIFEGGLGWFQHLGYPDGCIVDLTSHTIAYRRIDALDDRKVVLRRLSEVRRSVRRRVAMHFSPERVGYLPARWSDSKKYAGALSALRKWEVLKQLGQE